MEPLDEYRPDPPAGIGYADFLAARARFQARLAAQSEIARLERAFALDLPEGLAEARRPAAEPP
jgi:hypothetical protein